MKTSVNLTEGEAQIVNGAMPANVITRVGDRLKEIQDQGLVVQEVNVNAASNSTPFPFTADYSGTLIDAFAVGTATSGGGTATVRRVTTAITSAIVAAAIDVLSRTTTLVQAQRTLTQGEALNVITAGANDRAIVFLVIRRS